MGQASQNGKEPDLIGYRWNTLKGVSIHDKEEYFSGKNSKWIYLII